jgi:hypothetical protein
MIPDKMSSLFFPLFIFSKWENGELVNTALKDEKNLSFPAGNAMICHWITADFCDILPSANFPAGRDPSDEAGK